jgi:hypothetical protein
MVNSNFASSSIRQPNIAWPRPSTGPQVLSGLDLSAVRQLDLRIEANGQHLLTSVRCRS